MDPSKNKLLYFVDLQHIIGKNWDSFKNVFNDKKSFDIAMEMVNQLRYDCHAKEISEQEMLMFRKSILFLEECIKEYLS